MAVWDCKKAQNVGSMSVVPDKGTLKLTSPPHVSILSLFEVIYLSLCRSFRDLKFSFWKYLDLPRDCVNRYSSYTAFQRENSVIYSACGAEMDSEGDCLRKAETITESVEVQDTSGQWTKISLQVGQKIIQFLTDHSMKLLKHTSKGLKIGRQLSSFYWLSASEPTIPLHLSSYKFDNETMHDATNNRWPRYKCAAALDPRNIVLFLAILSSMGTMVLIYLTLTVDR